ncbi:MAG TPA: universal stress protein [Planctomycetota bacterium]
MKIRKILLPTDLSGEADRAFGPVGQLAKESGASITLYHVVYDPGVAPHGAPLAPPVQAADLPVLVEQARESIAGKRSGLPEEVPVDVVVESAPDVARAIAQQGSTQGHDLIALSTHGRSGFRRLMLGSVAEAVLRHAHVPVLVFPRAE